MRISDWSSDVCSSDLKTSREIAVMIGRIMMASTTPAVRIVVPAGLTGLAKNGRKPRSEERRVGKEGVSTGRSRWSRYNKKKKLITNMMKLLTQRNVCTLINNNRIIKHQ